MPTLRWDQVVEVTHDQAKQEILTFLDGAGFTATSWQKFSVPSLLVGIGAEIMSRGSKVAVFIKSLALNESSEGESLTRFSRSHYANERALAVAEQRRITLACAATEGPYPIGLGDIVISHADGPTFRNVAGLSVVYPATLASGGTLTLLVEAEVAGSAAHFADGALLSTNQGALVTTLAGVTITGDTFERQGIDEESDDRLKTRNSTKWPTLGQFEIIRDLVEHMALAASAAIAQVGVDDQNPRGAGTFDVYLAGAEGTAGSTEVAAVQAALDLRVLGQYADGGTPRGYARAAPETLLDVIGTVYYSGAYSQTDVIAAVQGSGPAIKGALRTFVEGIPLGGFDFSPGPVRVVRQSDVMTAIKEAQIGGTAGAVRTVVLTSPSSADLSVASFGKVRLGTVTLAYVPTDAG